MIKPKDKAAELVDKYSNYTSDWNCDEKAKQCALIAVDEVVENVHYFFDELSKDGLPNMFGDELDYWESVKYEIKNYETNS